MLVKQDYRFDENHVVESRDLFAEMSDSIQQLAADITVSELPMSAQLYNLRAVSRLWGVEIQQICEFLLEPPEDEG